MIYASLFDAGTELRKLPADVPGMDEAWWINSGWEESFFEHASGRRIAELNARMQNIQNLQVRPWPEPMPGKMWIDNTHRYRRFGFDGLKFRMSMWDRIPDTFLLAPAGDPELVTQTVPSPILEPVEGRLLRELSWREIQARAENPGEWYRLDTLNESEGTQLQEPLALAFRGIRGPLVPGIEDQSLFAPFDLALGESIYRAVDESGVEVPLERAWLYPRGTYDLYLRTRKWRYNVIVYATFLYISWFEMYTIVTPFVHMWYDRPPVYPLRHNILETSPGTNDAAIVLQFEQSQAAADLTQQIFQAQWWTLCDAFIFQSVERVEMWVNRMPPAKREVILGVSRIDQATGAESRVWVENRLNMTTVYPVQQIAYFEEVPWWIGEE
jgi:hypothetical protein